MRRATHLYRNAQPHLTPTMKLPSRTLRAASLALLLSSPILAQASGFQPGELIYYSQTIPNAGNVTAGIMRIDPASGAGSVLLDIGIGWSRRDALAFDAFRERVIFYGGLPGLGEPDRLYELDGFGNTTSLGFEGTELLGIAPGSGGRLYFMHGMTGEIHYLDANDQVHVLMDVAGTQPFVGPGIRIDAILYDAGTNALFVAIRRNSPWACGAPLPNSQIIRLQLSADGSKLINGPECVEVVVDPTVGNAPMGLSHGPSGQLIIFITAGTTGALPRMSLIDPKTLAVTPYAFSDYNGTLNAGSWSTTLGRAVIVDAFINVLRTYGPGETGEGTVITPSPPISGAGSGEGIVMVQVTRGDGTIYGPYCEAKTTASGCVPQIRATGSPSIGASSGFLIEAVDLPSQKLGLFFYGVSGPAAIPFLGGTKCMRRSPIRTNLVTSTGSGTCDGVLSIDFNAYLAAGGNPLIAPGTVVHGQFWFRDPAHPVGGVGLSDALTFTMLP